MKRKRERVNLVREKIADLLLDVAKYMLTGVVVATAASEMNENVFAVYVAGIFLTVFFVLCAIKIINYK